MTITRPHPSAPTRGDQHALQRTPHAFGAERFVGIARSLVAPLPVLCLAVLFLGMPQEGTSQTDSEIRSLSREAARLVRRGEAPFSARARTIDDGDTEDGSLRQSRPIALFFYRALETGMTRISVDAEDDTRLIVRGPMTHAGSFDSYPIAEDDDSGPGFNPEVTVMIRERGVYVITLAPYEPPSRSIDYEIGVTVRPQGWTP